MKTTLLLFSAVLVVSACSREQAQSRLSASQLNAVQQMQSSYLQARAYDDSLASALQSNAGSTMIHYYDEQYHHYDAAFTTCHQGYDHTYTSANHSHTSQGMVQMHGSGSGMMGGGGMMGSSDCQCCTNGGHSATMHDQMEALHQLHAGHHPH